jgi:hypothetical protein
MAATLHKAVLAQNSPLLASSTQTPAKAQLHTPAAARASATQQPAAAHHATWVSLGVGRDELSLEFCLPTGQSFRQGFALQCLLALLDVSHSQVLYTSLKALLMKDPNLLACIPLRSCQ